MNRAQRILVLILVFGLGACLWRGDSTPGTPKNTPTNPVQSPMGTALPATSVGTAAAGQTPSATPAVVPTWTAISPTSGTAGLTVYYEEVIAQSPAEFGVNGWWTDQDAALWSDRYERLNPAVVRIPAVQGLFEPQNDNSDPQDTDLSQFAFHQPLEWFDRTITLQRWLEVMKEQDITVMFHIPYLAGWASANSDEGLTSTFPPADLAEYEEYLRALLRFTIEEVGITPEKVILEPVNEPDLTCGADRHVGCFWANWTSADLLGVLEAAKRAAQAVSPQIRVIGVSECCGTRLAESLLEDPGSVQLLDGISYHHYVRRESTDAIVERGLAVTGYGVPVYLNEYGHTRLWSNGKRGALWHADFLAKIWTTGINPIQFPVSEFMGSHKAYDQLGLFEDWQTGWKIKPAFWVYANFYTAFAGTELLRVETKIPVTVLAARLPQDQALYLWLVNASEAEVDGLTVAIEDYPAGTPVLSAWDNLTGEAQDGLVQNAGEGLSFSVRMPANSSYLIKVSAGD